MRTSANPAPHAEGARQQGVALLVLVAILGVIALAVLIGRLTSGNTRAERDEITDAALARAKQALIAYAAGRGDLGSFPPGMLPCPDLDMPSKGVAYTFRCTASDKRLRRLPWKTLGLEELRDSANEPLWYAVSGNFSYVAGVGPINSDTTGSLTVRAPDGTVLFNAGTGGGVVAVIIAPGSAIRRAKSVADPTLIEQARANDSDRNNPANYLEIALGEDNADFADGGSNGFIEGPVHDAAHQLIANDRVMVITRAELMAAVEQRVAGELTKCIKAYAASAGSYPWPAPLAATQSYLGQPGSRFGRLPDSQANQPLARGLNDAGTKLQAAQSQLNAVLADSGASEASRRAAAQAMLDAANSSRFALDSLTNAVGSGNNGLGTLSATASTTAHALATADSSNATARSRNALDAINTLLNGIGNAGIDLFEPPLVERTTALQKARAGIPATQSDFDTWIVGLRTLASEIAGSTQVVPGTNPRIDAEAEKLFRDATDLITEIDKRPRIADVSALTARLDDTIVSALVLARTIDAQQHITLDIGSTTRRVLDALPPFDLAPDAPIAVGESTTNRQRLQASAQALRVAESATNDLTTASARRTQALASTDALLGLLDRDAPTTVDPQANLAISDANTLLGAALADPIQAAANVSYSILSAFRDTLAIAATNYGAQHDSTRLAALVTAGANLDSYLSGTYVPQLSQLNDAGNPISGSGSATTYASSLATAANKAVTTPTTANLSALTGIATNLQSKLAEAQALLSGQVAASVAINWSVLASGTCSDAGGWWTGNNWRAHTFYQIGSSSPSVAGSLTVGGKGAYRVIAVAAGSALPGLSPAQNRLSGKVYDWIEGRNADSSRNAPATNPAADFELRGTPGSTFNDQIGTLE